MEQYRAWGASERRKSDEAYKRSNLNYISNARPQRHAGSGRY